jgi:hypothetical protein
MSNRTEWEFIDSIDASFPIEDKAEAIKLIREADQLSENASLMVAYELVCGDEHASVARLELVDELKEAGRPRSSSPPR